MAQSTAERNTEEKLQAQLKDFEQRYQAERLEGLSVDALESKHERARMEAAHILSQFPPEYGATGSWRALAYGDMDESLAALSSAQEMEVFHRLERCLEKIEKVRTERKDKLRQERWKRINETLQSAAQIIPALS